jgi:hypothetical protein
METLTKLDVARRQLDEAIRMFFEKRDTVSTHTVASAAAQVIADLGRARGFPGWTRNPDIFKPGRYKEWRADLTKFEAFFKHAGSDPNASCDFHPELTPLFIMESVHLFWGLSSKQFTWPGLVFAIWFCLTHPDMIQESELKRAATTVLSRPMTFDVNDLSGWALLLTTPAKGVLAQQVPNLNDILM